MTRWTDYPQQSPDMAKNARDYCRQIGADPEELVRGWDTGLFGKGVAIVRRRWEWYLGVSEAALRKPIP